jgi:hypothetical protein
MFNNRVFRTTPELDFLRGPMLSAYLRFEILLWGLIAVLSLLMLLGQIFLPTPGTTPTELLTPGLLATLAFSLAVVFLFIAIWRFKQWGVYLLALWTGLMIVGAVAAIVDPARDWLLIIALLGLIMARSAILWFEIRPKWRYFEGGLA